MPPNSPQFDAWKKGRRLRLPKIAPRKTKGLFEEYFYVFLGTIFAATAIMGKASGMSAYNAIVVGLWAAAFTWFARQVKGYLDYRANPEGAKKSGQAAKPAARPVQEPTPVSGKPMFGLPWSKKSAPGKPQNAQVPSTGDDKPKPAFIYERPTLPDRKPKFPANWPGKPNKKPKR